MKFAPRDHKLILAVKACGSSKAAAEYLGVSKSHVCNDLSRLYSEMGLPKNRRKNFAVLYEAYMRAQWARSPDPLDGVSFWRGYPCKWDGATWVFVDNGLETPPCGGALRPCAKCGRTFPLDTPDPCIGLLPGVVSACCGHGIPGEAYAIFDGGLKLTGDFLFLLANKQSHTEEE